MAPPAGCLQENCDGHLRLLMCVCCADQLRAGRTDSVAPTNSVLCCWCCCAAMLRRQTPCCAVGLAISVAPTNSVLCCWPDRLRAGPTDSVLCCRAMLLVLLCCYAAPTNSALDGPTLLRRPTPRCADHLRAGPAAVLLC
jgi:hypothetical protein